MLSVSGSGDYLFQFQMRPPKLEIIVNLMKYKYKKTYIIKTSRRIMKSKTQSVML